VASASLDDLRAAAIEALHAHDRLLELWRQVQEVDLASVASVEDVRLLRELIIRRIYPVNAFGLLVRIDQAAAIDILLSRYVGITVDPDSKFGGFEFELGTMLDDLREVGGTDRIVQLIQNPNFAIERIAEPRFQRVFGQVLELGEEQTVAWARAQRSTAQE
jgi:hypothetical protein